MWWIRSLLIISVVGCWSIFPSKVYGHHGLPQPELSAKAAAVIDVKSGRMLFEKQAGKRMPIASITKIMTAIIAIEHGNLDQKVKVSSRAEGVEGSSIYLKQGESIPLKYLLYGLMLRSGNDAAVAIAEHIGGSVEGFVYKMNEKARYLGMENTHFENPHGLDGSKHYSTAEDMAQLAAYALKNPVFQKIVQSSVITVPWPKEKWKRKWYNKNKMLRLYPGADGVKTGYTKRSKRTLVSSATRDGRQIATVTLNAPDDWNDSMHLLEYGFNHFQEEKLVSKGEVMKPVSNSNNLQMRVVASRHFTYPITKEERDRVNVKPIITHPLSNVREEGVQVGFARILIDGQVVGSVPLETQVVVQNSQEDTMFYEWVNLLASVFERGE